MPKITESVSIESSALPSGGATSGLQTSGNTSLSAIVLSIASVDTKTPSLGQAAMAASVPVVIASNQSAIPVSLSALPALVAGSAIVGKFGIDQTTPGTTNGVQINAALPAGTNAIGKLAANSGVTIGAVEIAASQTVGLVAGSAVIGHVINDAGSAIIGKVGIDQTTPGTTNGVQINAALPAGSNVIGHVIVDTAPTTVLQAETTKVIGTVNIASAQTVGLVAGSAIVGKFGIDQTTPGTTNGVQVNAALPTGTNVIGHVIVDTAPTTVLQAETTKVIGTVNIAGSQTVGLVAGSAAIGKLAANSGVTIGAVEIAASQTLATVTTVGTVSAVTGITNALPAGTNRLGSVRPVDSADADLTAAKGSQTSRALGTQDLKDSGRTAVVLYATGVASGSTGTETIIAFTKAIGITVTTAQNDYTVTSGKKLRITSIVAASRGNVTATAQVTTFTFRTNAGAITTSSAALMGMRTATPATALAWDRVNMEIPDGYEIAGDGTLRIGMTANAVFTTNAPTWDFILHGFEY